MAGIIQRGGTYYLTYRSNGKEVRESLRTASRSEALKAKRAFEYHQDQSNPPAINPSTPTQPATTNTRTTPLAVVVGEYARHLKATKRHAVARRDVHILARTFGPITPELEMGKAKTSPKKRKPITHTLDAPSFQALTPATITRHLDARRSGDKLSARSVNRIRQVLNSLCNHAIRQGEIEANPVHAVPRYKEPTPEITFLSLEQIGEQLAALERHSTIKTMVAIHIYAGLRREEALWLTTGDVDMTAGMIRVRAKTINGKTWQPKTGCNRVVPISRTLRAILEQHHTRRGLPFYFTTDAGEQWTPDNFTATLRRINRKAGMNWGPKEYRHTFASQLALRGLSLYQIAKLMGNSPDVAAKYYAALVPEQMGELVEFTPPPALKIAGSDAA